MSKKRVSSRKWGFTRTTNPTRPARHSNRCGLHSPPPWAIVHTLSTTRKGCGLCFMNMESCTTAPTCTISRLMCSLPPIGRGVVELPQYFMDMFHLEMSRGKSKAETWDIGRVDFENPGLRIFSFHPVHLLLNTGIEEDYFGSKVHYQDTARLRELANKGEGTATFLTALVEQLKRKGIQPYLLPRDSSRWHPAIKGRRVTLDRSPGHIVW